jgi:hypothetical protein
MEETMNEEIKVGDKFRVPKGRLLAGDWTVEENIHEEDLHILVDASATEKRNAAYQEEQARKIKERWKEQQANPRQYLAWGVVTAPGFQLRGPGRR